MSFTGLTEPIALDDGYGPIVRFDSGDEIECGSMHEAEALAEAWRQWPHSGHPPVDQSRGTWRTGFADGAVWARAAILADLREWARPLGNSPDDDVLRLVLARIEGAESADPS